MARVLALDVGTSSVRARAYDETATWEEEAEAHLPYSVSEPDADVLVAAARAVLDEAAGEARGDVDAYAISCFWHSLLAVDAHGRPVSPLLTWHDRRAAAQAERLHAQLDGDAVHARTGAYLHPSYWPAQLLWLREELPDVWRDAAHFLPFGAYLAQQLCSEALCSVSLTSGTGLLDVRSLAWDAELLGVVGVEPERLPPVDDEPYGAWFPPLGDGACSNVGVGCTTRERAALMIGTSGAYRVVYETDEPRPRPGLFLYRLDRRRVVEGGAVSDGGNLFAWLQRTLRLAEPVELGEREPDAHGLTVLPLLGGERSPGWHADARGALAGLTFATTPEDIWQAALEGIAFRIAEIADLMPEVEEVVATGGALLADEAWVQVFADVLGRPVVVSGADEGSARGAAVQVLERLGHRPAQAPLGETFEPRADRHAAFRSARERQRNLYERLG
jgi:gluconokinase